MSARGPRGSRCDRHRAADRVDAADGLWFDAAAAVAVFPTDRPNSRVGLTPLQDHLGESVVSGIHFIAAAAFILSLAVLSYYFGKREGARPPRTGRRSPRFWRSYHWICAAIILAALLWSAVTELLDIGPSRSLLYGEAVAVWAFGASWLWKGLELDLLRGGSESEPHEQALA